MADNDLRFPKRFLWGVAISAHQVEGGNHNNWTVWELENAKTHAQTSKYKLQHLPTWEQIKRRATDPNNYVSGRAVDHYNRYEDDFDIARRMNLNAFRFSIEWSRIEPEEGVWNAKEIEHYRQYIAALKKRGLEPLVTLYHWTVPTWFSEKGAFARSGNVKYFVRFADKILEELGKDLRVVTTINEPDTVAVMGYLMHEHAPGAHSFLKMLWVYRNHLKAHKQIYVLAKKRSRRFKVGFVKSYTHSTEGDDRLLSRFMVRFDRFVRDDVVLNYVGRKTDFLGVNYYITDKYRGLSIETGAVFNNHPGDSVSDMGWSLHPENLKHVLLRLGKRKKPIIVTETGVADREDKYRKQWLSGTIRSVQVALDAGVDVQGYMCWTLLDNFEWAFGRWPCFGLVEVDYEDGLCRIPRDSARYYAAVVKKARGI